MNRNPHPGDGASARRWESVEVIGQAFERAWLLSDAPPLEAYLPPPAHPLYLPALVRLAALDLERQWLTARAARVESYLDAWPALRGDEAAIQTLLAAECLARGIYASPPESKEVQARFPELAARLDLRAIEQQALAKRRDRSYLGSERFFVIRQLGKGGMGIVYAALDRQRNQVIALKALPVTRPQSLYYFKQEFRNLTEIVHPHLAAPYELLSIGGQWFFTMELIDGVSFAAYMRGLRQRSSPDPYATRKATDGEGAGADAWCVAAAEDDDPPDLPAVSYEQLRDLLRQLADTLDALHHRGILHRDLKPSNVMVRRDGSLVVLDFGLSTHLATASHDEASLLDAPPGSSSASTWASTARKLAGTVPYMSPEQCLGLPLTEASDWYAVGVMLFLVLTGRLPFTGTPLEIAAKKHLGEPPDPRDLQADVPDDLRDICLGLLARQTRERWNGERVRRRLGAASSGEQETAHLFASSIPFVGRGEQLATLQQAYQDLAAGATLCVHVYGPSGVGKSRLVSQFLRHAPPAGHAVILTGRCYESESVPFKGLDTIIDSLCRFLRSLPEAEAAAVLPSGIAALARMFPVLSRIEAIATAVKSERRIPDAQPLRRRAFAALRELLCRLGRQFPLILAIDDLQWGDVDSAAVLAELFRPPGVPRLLLIAIYRSEYRGENACLDLLAAIGAGLAPAPREEPAPCEERVWSETASAGARIEERTIRRDIPVGPLSHDESRQMASHLLGETDSPERRADAIARQAQGSPYFILEMAEHARSGIHPAGASAAALDLDAALQTRLQRLPEPTRRLLEVVAVAGQPLELRTTLEAARLTSADHAHVAALRSQHLLRTHGPGLDDPVSTYHDKIRESVVAQLAPAALTERHRHLASALERTRRADAEQIARHLDAAGESARAGRYYAQAADEAAGKLAFDRAARLYQRCLELLTLDAGERRTLSMKLADALANAGRGLEAALRYEKAAQGAPIRETFELRRRAAYQFCISGHLDEGRQALQDLLAAIGVSLPGSPARSLAALLANRCRLFLRGTSFRLRPPEQIDPKALHRIDVIWTASAGLSMFDVVAGADFQTRGCLLALQAGEPFRLSRALAWEAAHLSNLGGRTWRRAQRLLGEACRLAEQAPDPYARGWTALCDGIVNFTNGRWVAARGQLELAERVLRGECTGVAWELNTAHAFTLWALFYVGDLPEMHRRAASLAAEALERGDQYAAATHSTFSLPMSQLADGDPQAARGTLADALARWTCAGFHVQHIIALMCQTYIDLYCGQGEAAWRRMQEQWPLVARSQLLRVQVLRSLLKHLRGRAALACARRGGAAGPLLRAARRDARQLLRENMPYCTPHGRHLLAGIAEIEGDRPRAVDLLAEAAQGYENCGMRLFAAALRGRLGQLRGDGEGQAAVEEAYTLLEEQGVQDVERFMDALTAIPQPTPAKVLSRSPL